jgi:hypothetical protein
VHSPQQRPQTTLRDNKELAEELGGIAVCGLASRRKAGWKLDCLSGSSNDDPEKTKNQDAAAVRLTLRVCVTRWSMSSTGRRLAFPLVSFLFAIFFLCSKNPENQGVL